MLTNDVSVDCPVCPAKLAMMSVRRTKQSRSEPFRCPSAPALKQVGIALFVIGAACAELSGAVAANLPVSVTVHWILPETTADGSPLVDLAGSRVYVGTASGSYDRVIEAGNQTSITVSNLHRATTYYIAVTGYNSWGAEGILSPEARWRYDDTNLNGITDRWEIHYFGDIGNVGPESDADGDGLTNLEEFLGGTDPRVASAEHLVDASTAGNQTRISFTTTAMTPGDPLYEGQTRYAAIESYVPSRGAMTMHTVAQGACNGQTLAYTVPTSESGTHRFFRARLWLAPSVP